MNIFVESYTLQSGTSVATQEHMEETSMRRNRILEQQYATEKRQKEFENASRAHCNRPQFNYLIIIKERTKKIKNIWNWLV